MLLKNKGKLTIMALSFLSAFFLTGAGNLWAFSVDLKNLYYADNENPTTLKRVVDYDFSGGTLTDNTIAIPGSFVTPDPYFDTGLTYTFGPYPDPNDIAVSFDPGSLKATLTSAVQGGCIISTIPTLPDSGSIVPQWEFLVQFSNFSGMSDASKEYRTQIGFGSMTPGPHPEFTAIWAPGDAGRVLLIHAEIYNDNTEQTEWSLTSAPITGIDPAGAFIELRVAAVPNVSQGYLDINFQYRFSESDSWIDLGTSTIGPPPPPFPLFSSFPAYFPYVSLDTEVAESGSEGTAISGTINAGTSGYTSGNIYVAVYGEPWPSLNRLASTVITAAGPYTISDLPADTDLYVYARWDTDGSDTRTPGDWTGQYPSNPAVISGGVNPTNIDITLTGQVQGANVSGNITCSEFAPNIGDLKAFAYDGPDPSTARLVKAVTISKANINGTSIPYTLSNLAVNGYLFIFSRWDKDNDGTSSAGDLRGGYSFNPLLILDGENTGINMALPSSVPTGDVLAGTWGVLHLQYEVGPQNWYSEAARVTFNGDGTGLLTGVKNDEMNWGTPGQIKPFGFPFTYTIGSNADGSLNLTMTVTTNEGTETFSQRIVLSDNGNMAIQDGTGDPEWVRLSTIIKIDTTRSYSINDFGGEYYGIGYERNRGTIVDPPNGNGAYMAISSADNFNSAEWTYNYYGYANSIKGDGSVIIWNDSGFDSPRPYAVNPDGTVSVQGGAFRGYLSGDGAVGVGSGSFSLDGPGSWVEYAFLKKGDRAYTQADLAGKWALVAFGDEKEGNQVFMSSIGTMTCDTAGVCTYKFKNSLSNGSLDISTGSATLSLAADGSFGGSLAGAPPAYAGALGNDGNTLIFNNSFDPAETGRRQIFIGVRAGNVGDLAGESSSTVDETTIRTNFGALVTAFNSQNIDQFMSLVSANYLDDGITRDMFRAEILDEFGETLPSYTMTVTIMGNAGKTIVNWADGEIDIDHWLKEGDMWMLYGNQYLFDSWANSGHQMYSDSPYPYWVSLDVHDPEETSGITITGVNVKGPGLPAEGIALYHDEQSGKWHSWSQDVFQENLGPQWATQPSVPLEYTFTISYTGGTGTSPAVQICRINSFVNVAPPQESISPAANAVVTRPVVFSWGSAGEGYRYRVEVNDANYNRIWETEDDLTGTSWTYDGPTLGGGQYYYNLITEDGFDNMSMIQVPFRMSLLYFRTAVTTGTGTDNHPSWSPDGTKIAFTSNRSGVDNIWAVNRDGFGMKQLTTSTGGFDAKYPSWSPDGTRIAYIFHDPDPNPVEGAFDGYFLYTMNPDGSNQTLHPLPPGSSQDQSDLFWEFEIKFTEWLDNDRIAFVSFGPEGGSLKLYSYLLSTGAVTQIVPTPEEANPGGEIYRISWNAATGRLAYDRWPIGIQTITDTGANYQILDIPRVTQMDTPSMPGWRPDGARMAFVKNLYDISNIGIFDTAAGTAIIEGTTTDDEWPAWSPDGDAIAFVSDGNIWLMSLTQAIKGDLNNDESVDLGDAILALKSLAGLGSTGLRPYYPVSGADVNSNGRVGFAEAIYILQYLAGLRQ